MDGEGRPNGDVRTVERIDAATGLASTEVLKGQDYFLMVASDQDQHFTKVISASKGPLHTEQVFDFLVNLPRDAVIIGYGLNYDLSMWLIDFSLEERLAFLDRDARRYRHPERGTVQYHPYHWRGWELDWFGSAFKIRKVGHRNGRWTTVWDAIKQYQKSFIHTMEVWHPDASQEVHDLIVQEKMRRGGEDKVLATQTQYSLAECSEFALIHTRFRRVLLDHGIHIRSWHAASITKALMKLHKVDEHHPVRKRIVTETGASYWQYPEGEPVHGVLDKASYIGGRFELAAHGPVPRVVYENDITSAYPFWLKQLPSWRGSAWEHCTSRAHVLRHKGWFLALVSWEMPENLMWGPFGKRSGSNLVFSRSGWKHWVWSPEVMAAYRAGLGKHFTIHESYLLHTGEDTKPFSYLEDLYQLRADLERQQKGRGDPLKVGLNSTYGATAEQTTDTPYWQCLAWAGMTTSGTRAQVYEAIMDADPAATLAVATDAFYSLVPRPEILSPTKTLGGWEQTIHEGGWFFAQSGILIPMKEDGKIKSRGLPARDLATKLPDFLAAWQAKGTAGIVPVSIHRFYGLRVGSRRPGYWNHWVDEVRQISLKVEPKRRDPFLLDGLTRSYPCHVGQVNASDAVGYEPEYMSYSEDKQLALDQPDWSR